MEGDKPNPTRLPRIVPTRDRLEALNGTWELNGETIELFGERSTGVLLAFDLVGREVNPCQVLSQGRKLSEAEARQVNRDIILFA